MRRTSGWLAALGALWTLCLPARAVEVRASRLQVGDRFTVAIVPTAELPSGSPPLESGTFWDLRPIGTIASESLVRFTVVDPRAGEPAGLADDGAADRALCATALPAERDLGCEPFRAADARATRLRVVASDLGPADTIVLGTRYSEIVAAPGGGTEQISGGAVAEGLLLVPGGPREVVLVREEIGEGAARVVRHRFLTPDGRVAALVEGPRAEILVDDDAAKANDGMKISYPELHAALTPGNTGFVQRSVYGNVALSAVHPAWTTVAGMISIDATSVPYQPDPDDPGSLQSLPEVWDFTSLSPATLAARTMNTTRDDSYAGTCLEGASACSVKNVSASPPDGSWQAYLKIDRFDTGGVFLTRDIFALNDNDTGANPSIDVPYVAQDESNFEDRTQVCLDDSAGGANRFLKFFRFTGASPASALLGVGDTWTSGNWTSCSDAAGLRLVSAIAGGCGDHCYPTCDGLAPPRARGMLGSGAGFRMTAIEDGFVHVPPGNYVPALLLRQDTDLQAGRDFLGTCNLATTRQRSFDYFWVQKRYGLLASVSSPNDVAPYTMPADNWAAVGNQTDGADITWGPYPPYQTRAQACLAGTRVSWSLPLDGSNLTDDPGVSDYGYVVSWGALGDPEALADWATNANHTPLPGTPGYLAAPVGGEPTSAVVTGWALPAIDVTVVTALRYADPDVGDLRQYRSAAFYRVHEDPARLDGATFRVGQGVVPFVTSDGTELDLAWPAVAGAAGYRLRVFDLDLRAEIACPAGMDCSPAVPETTQPGGVTDGRNYGYVAYAVDPCGGLSLD